MHWWTFKYFRDGQIIGDQCLDCYYLFLLFLLNPLPPYWLLLGSPMLIDPLPSRGTTILFILIEQVGNDSCPSKRYCHPIRLCLKVKNKLPKINSAKLSIAPSINQSQISDKNRMQSYNRNSK